jgi:hypothetical protein
MPPSQADAPQPRLAVTVLVVVLAMVFWCAILAEFLYAAPMAMRVFGAEARRQPWTLRMAGPIALQLAEQPAALGIPIVVAAILIGAPTWLIRHRLGWRRLGTIWCVLMVLLPLLLALANWFGTIQPLIQQVRELQDRNAQLHARRLDA